MTTKNDQAIRTHVPLRPAMLHILATLAEGARHGYAVKKEVEARTKGVVRLGPGTLYETLERLESRGLVREVRSKGEGVDHAQRRYYELTRLGRRVLEFEMSRLSSLVEDTRRALEGTSSP
jgi:DNA-binding PadR family transcriptional regulator